MMISKEELIRNIEEARERLNKSIDHDDDPVSAGRMF